MRDRTPDLEERLADWFAAETQRADRDLRVGVRPRREPRRASGPRTLAAGLAVLAVVAAGALGLRSAVQAPAGAAPPSGTSVTSATPVPATPTPAGTRVGNVTLGADGLPVAIGTETVVRLDALRAALIDEDSTIVAGWVDQPLYACAQPEWPLIPTCTGRRLSAEEPAGRSGGPSVDLVVGELDVPFGRVAVRVHTGDPGAESCPPGVRARCAAAIVVDEVVWRDESTPAVTGLAPDGIPSDVDAEPVLRPAELAEEAASRTGPWLLGGWHTLDGFVGAAPGQEDVAVAAEVDVPAGPVVVRVVVDDERVVAEEVVWTGDSGSTGAPLDAFEVTAAIRSAVDQERFSIEPAPPAKDGCDPGWPPVLWRGTERTGTIGLIAIYPSTEEADQADGRLGAAGWQGAGCTVTFDSSVTWQWVRVGNAIVQFNLTLPHGTPEQLQLVERVRGALEAAAAT